ncbi:MAG: nuclear transport factor 2 family protein [Rhizomicrobium sp.]
MTTEQKVQDLVATIARLESRIGNLEAESAVRRLQYTYGYLIDKCMYNEAVDLFAENGEVRFMGGIYKGKEGVRRLYIGRFRKNFTNDYNGPVFGFLLDHPQLQAVIDVAPDGKSAKLRGRSVMQAGRHESITEAGALPRQWWEGGIYENEYVKEDGVWKIKVLDYNPLWHGMFDKGWAHTPPNAYPFASKTYPEDPLGPDVIAPEPHRRLWPETPLVPFHYTHPVTGKPMVPQQPEQWRAK